MYMVESFPMALASELGTDEAGGQTTHTHALDFLEQLSCLKRKKTHKTYIHKKAFGSMCQIHLHT